MIRLSFKKLLCSHALTVLFNSMGNALKGTCMCRFLVTEGRERVGGNITSVSGNGYRWEEGPSSFQPNDAMLKAAVCSSLPYLTLSKP